MYVQSPVALTIPSTNFGKQTVGVAVTQAVSLAAGTLHTELDGATTTVVVIPTSGTFNTTNAITVNTNYTTTPTPTHTAKEHEEKGDMEESEEKAQTNMPTASIAKIWAPLFSSAFKDSEVFLPLPHDHTTCGQGKEPCAYFDVGRMLLKSIGTWDEMTDSRRTTLLRNNMNRDYTCFSKQANIIHCKLHHSPPRAFSPFTFSSRVLSLQWRSTSFPTAISLVASCSTYAPAQIGLRQCFPFRTMQCSPYSMHGI